jgi:hypothetical protein
MSGSTTNYGLIKPTVGGSENEWGGNLNDDLDKIDALLGGDEPISGIEIISGEIDGGAIVGEIGGADPDNPVTIHPDTEISGKVKRLEGMDDPDGTITNVDLEARQIQIEGRIVEGTTNGVTGTSATFSPDQGTIHSASISANSTYTYDLAMPVSGMALTLILSKQTTQPTNIVWQYNGNPNFIKWIGGGEPDLNVGINVIQFFTHDMGTGPVCFGAYSGVAS